MPDCGPPPDTKAEMSLFIYALKACSMKLHGQILSVQYIEVLCMKIYSTNYNKISSSTEDPHTSNLHASYFLAPIRLGTGLKEREKD